MTRPSKSLGTSKACNEIFAYITTLQPDLLDAGRFEEMIGALSGERNDIFDRALREGLSGFLFRAMESTQLSGLFPSDKVDRITRVYYSTVQKNLALEHELQRIVENTKSRGIDIVVLQGMALIQTIYADIGLRAMTDIDLWVRETDRPVCFDILTSMGFVQDSLYPGTFRNGATVLDIHSHLFWSDRIRSRKNILSVDDGLLFEAAEPSRRKQLCPLVLNPYDQVLYLGLHLLKHNADRLIWLVDIKSILEHFDAADWHTLADRAEYLGLARSLAYIRYLLFRLLQFKTPAELNGFMEHYRPGTGATWLLRRRIHRHALPSWAPLILFSSRMTLREKLPFVWENLFPRLQVLRQVFPDSAQQQSWQLYLKRLAQITGIRR